VVRHYPKANTTWLTARVKNPFKKPNQVGFSGFIGFGVLLSFFYFNVQREMLFTSNECVKENN